MTEILISLQEAIEAIESVPEGNWKASRYTKELEKLDPVQPERKKGKWTIDEDCEGKSRMVTCNLCGYEEFNWHNPNFCPNCGADMRGEQDE